MRARDEVEPVVQQPSRSDVPPIVLLVNRHWSLRASGAFKVRDGKVDLEQAAEGAVEAAPAAEAARLRRIPDDNNNGGFIK